MLAFNEHSPEPEKTQLRGSQEAGVANSKHLFTTYLLGGRCRKAMLGVCEYSSVVERRTRHQKVAGLSPGRRGGRIVLSRVNFLC